MRQPPPDVEDFMDCVELEDLVAYLLMQSVAYMQDMAAEIEAQLENSIVVDVTFPITPPGGQSGFMFRTSFNRIPLLLLGVTNANKIDHIKVIRKHTNMGLKESKAVADTLHAWNDRNIEDSYIKLEVFTIPGGTCSDILNEFHTAGIRVAVPSEWIVP